MIVFKKLRYRNLLSTGAAFTEIDLQASPLTLIVGTNGSGKSTFMDALCIVLFNRAFRNVNKSDVVNSVNLKDCMVSVEFEVDTVPYRVHRGINPNIFDMWQRDKVIEQMPKAKQATLETILGFNYETFTQIAILGSSSFVPFMKLEAADRRAVIEDLLDIQVFSEMNVLVKDQLTIFKTSISMIESDIKTRTHNIGIIRKMRDDAQADRATELTQLEGELRQLQQTSDQLRVEVVELEKNPILAQEKPLKSKLNEIMKARGSLNAKVKTLIDTLNFYGVHDNCPTCKQSITEEFKKAELASQQPKLVERAQALKQLEDLEKHTNKELIDIENLRTLIRSKYDSQPGTAIILTQKAIDKIKQQQKASVAQDDLLAGEEKELVDQQSALVGQREEQRYHNACAALLKDDGIKAKIIRQYLPVINKTVNEYLKAMDFFVAIEFDEQFNETIKSRHRDNFTYEHFSEGERMRIDLALLLTWRTIAKLKSRMNTNILILDEIFDSSLDSDGLDGFMRILETWDASNVFVISHKGDMIADQFDRTIKFEKVGNFSRIVTENDVS